MKMTCTEKLKYLNDSLGVATYRGDRVAVLEDDKLVERAVVELDCNGFWYRLDEEFEDDHIDPKFSPRDRTVNIENLR